MSGKITYTDEPVQARVVEDFLPPPEELVFKNDNVKITIALSKSTVDFFKDEAQKQGTKYQKMIRRLLDLYAEHHRPAH